MTGQAPAITTDVLIELLQQVITENASRVREKLATVAWTPDTSLEDIGFDSFDFVELIFKIEDRFDIEIGYNANDNVNDVKTIGELYAQIENIVAKKRAA